MTCPIDLLILNGIQYLHGCLLASSVRRHGRGLGCSPPPPPPLGSIFFGGWFFWGVTPTLFLACQRGWWCTMDTPILLRVCMENWPKIFEEGKKVTESHPPPPPLPNSSAFQAWRSIDACNVTPPPPSLWRNPAYATAVCTLRFGKLWESKVRNYSWNLLSLSLYGWYLQYI